MRKFTKEHNELDFLFPDIKESGEYWFEHWEKVAEYRFEHAHQNETEFVKDDIIDVFMKGASEAQRTLILRAINTEQFAERMMEENQRLEKQLQYWMNKALELHNKIIEK